MNVGPLSWGSVLNTWTTAPIADLLCALAAAGYLWRAYRTLPRIGQRWPIRRTAAFLGGLAVLLLTLHSFIGVYAHPSFTIHMVLHLLVIMVVPALVIMGQPLRMLSATSDRLGTGTQSTLGSPVMRVLTFPGVGLLIYAVVLIGTHLTPFMQLMLQHTWLHQLEIVLYLIGGYLYFLPVLSHEPLNLDWSYPLRVFLLLMGMTADTVVGVVLMMYPEEPFPAYALLHPTWTPMQLVNDIHVGGSIMWVFGDGLMLLITLIVIKEWLGDTERQNDTGKWLESARRSVMAAQTGEERLADAENVDDDEALAAYNRMLARLHEREQAQHDHY